MDKSRPSLKEAESLLNAGDRKGALELLLRIAEGDSQNVEALFALATVQLQIGNTSEAALTLDKVLELAPNHPWALLLRCKLAREEGDLERCERLAPILVERAAGRSDLLFEAGLTFFELQSFRFAVACFDRVWAGQPEQDVAGFWLAKSLVALGRLLQARTILKAITPFSKHKNPYLLLAEVELSFGETQNALSACKKALQYDPADELAHVLSARALTVEKNTESAAREWSKAVECSVLPARVLTAQGFILQSQGDFEGALAAFSKATRVDPRDGYSFSVIAQAKKVTPDDEDWVVDTQFRLEQSDLSKDSKRHFHFALGKCFHDLKRHEKAWHHYAEGNRLLREVLFDGKEYDAAKHHSLVDEVQAVFSPEALTQAPTVNESAVPIFVVGMIRSGTTLVEQIISSHPEVSGAGELPFWQMNWPSFLDLDSGNIDFEKLKIGTDEFVDLLRTYGKGMSRVTDKNPANYMLAGLLHIAYPNAKIVCVRRKPIDTAMSIWMTAMRRDAGYQGDQKGIVAALKEATRMNDYWSETLPPSAFHAVSYEQLIGNREAETRRLLAFLDLPWDDRCLSPESNVRDILTPSFWQVRQAVYASSIDRWKPYEPWLGAFQELVGVD